MKLTCPTTPPAAPLTALAGPATWPGTRTVTLAGAPLLACSSGASCDSGTVKLTPIGSTWLIVTSAALLGDTRLPGYTAIAPARPASGERIWL